MNIYPICTKYLRCIYRGCMHIYMPHIKSLASTKQQWVLYTYLANITQQRWLLHSKYSSHGLFAIWPCLPNIYIYIYICQKTINCNFHFIWYCQICARNKYAYQTAKYWTGIDRGGMHIHKVHIWNHLHQPGNMEQCTHIWHITLKKYGFHIPNIPHIAKVLNGHEDWTFLHIYI